MPAKNQTWKPFGKAGVRSTGVYSSVSGVPRYRPSETKLRALPLNINAAEALSSTAIPLLFENPRYCKVVCLARKAESVAVAVIVKIKPVPVVLAEPEALVVALVDIGMPEDEEPGDEEPEDEELDDEALTRVLLVEVEALMGPTEIVVDDDMLLLKLPDDVEALLEPTKTVVEGDMPVLVVLEIEEVVVVLTPIGPTLAEGFEVVLALIGATEEELEGYQSSQAWGLA